MVKANHPNIKNSDNIIYGIHSVSALLQQHPEQIQKLLISTDRHDQRIQKLLQLAKTKQIQPEQTSRHYLDQYAPEQAHQGVIAVLYHKEINLSDNLEEILDNLSEPPLLLILDGVQDPHNLGACLRTANAAGVHAVIAPKDRAAPLNATARKVASGAAEITPFITVTNLARTLRFLKDQGIWLTGTADDATCPIYQIDLTEPSAIIMGAEGEGLRRLTKEHCDYLAAIPMAGSVSSLNVSVATGVCLFEAVRQRRIIK